MREDILTTKLEKLEKLKVAFGTAYPDTVKRTHTNREVLTEFDKLTAGTDQVSVAGRVKSLRVMGKIAFCHIEDGTDKLQAFFALETLGEETFKLFKDTVDLGDFIAVTGAVFLTKQNEKSVRVTTWQMLTKSLRPIPTEFYGLKDEEELLRRRYLDLLMNSETRELFVKKNAFWQTVRRVLAEKNFLEVQTPVLEHIPGGAEAEPFVTHHNALDADFYLRISLELALKRLLVGGYERVFEIGRVFRNEGIDREHLQEFDHMEFYAAYMNMEQGMELVEKMYKDIVRAVVGESMTTEHEGETINWNVAFPRVDYFTEFKKETGLDLSDNISLDDLKKKADELHIKYEKSYGKGRMIDTIYKKTVRQKLIQPCFLVGHPLEVSPLAKTDPKNPRRTLRFQPIAGKSELGNGFAELNDPIDQRARFEEQMKLRDAGDKEGMMLDEDFIQALEYGMPPACGFGMSERLFAILMNRSVRETVIFPPMKGKEEKLETKKELQLAVALINRGASLKPWQELNTIAHLNAAFGARQGKELFFQDEIETSDQEKIKLNIQHAIIVKTAASSQDLQKLVSHAKDAHLAVAEFTSEMLETTNDKKVIAVTKEKSIEEINHLGVLVFGNKKKVEELTGDFNLYE